MSYRWYNDPHILLWSLIIGLAVGLVTALARACTGGFR